MKNLTKKSCICDSEMYHPLAKVGLPTNGAGECTIYDAEGDGIMDSTGLPLKGCVCF